MNSQFTIVTISKLLVPFTITSLNTAIVPLPAWLLMLKGSGGPLSERGKALAVVLGACFLRCYKITAVNY